MTTITAGLIADTHIPYRARQLPDAVFEAFVGVDVILHAGDVDDPSALEPLRSIAPVHAVRGNYHVLDFSDGGASLPDVIELELGGKRVVLTHGHETGFSGLVVKGLYAIGQAVGVLDNGKLNQRNARRLVQRYPGADIIVFGHAHRAYVAWMGSTLLVNPGAVVESGRYEQPSVARLQIAHQPTVEIVPLPTSQIGGNLCLRAKPR
jgi:putative phosphoesterase